MRVFVVTLLLLIVACNGEKPTPSDATDVLADTPGEAVEDTIPEVEAVEEVADVEETVEEVVEDTAPPADVEEDTTPPEDVAPDAVEDVPASP